MSRDNMRTLPAVNTEPPLIGVNIVSHWTRALPGDLIHNADGSLSRRCPKCRRFQTLPDYRITGGDQDPSVEATIVCSLLSRGVPCGAHYYIRQGFLFYVD